MGSMYWQFNDLWQAPTWATIEYHKDAGKWKMAHYYVKNAYEQLIISPVFSKSNSELEFYAISDLPNKIESQFVLNVHSYDSFEARLTQTFNFSIDPFLSARVASIDIDALEKLTGCLFNKPDSCILTIGDGYNFMFFNHRLADVTNLKVANLTIESVEMIRTGTFSVRVKSDQVALFVWLDITTTSFCGIFSDNGFHMVQPSLTVTFTTDSTTLDENMLRKYLTVQTLANSY